MMKGLTKSLCFVLFISSFLIFFSFVGNSEVNAQLVETCTEDTIGQPCDLGDGEEGVCEGVENIYGGYSSLSCEGPDVPTDDSQCTSENVGADCLMGDGSDGVCVKVWMAAPDIYQYNCEDPAIVNLPSCTEDTHGEPCRINNDTVGVCMYVYDGMTSQGKYVCREDDPNDPYDPGKRNWGDEKTAPPPPEFEGNVSAIVDRVLGYLFPIAGVIALIFIIMGGYMWIVSAGDPNKVKQAQGTLTWAVAGLVIVMVIFGIIRILLNFLS